MASYHLGIAGHVNPLEPTDEEPEPVDLEAAVDEACRLAGENLVRTLRELGVEPTAAGFAGPAGFVNYLTDDEDPIVGAPTATALHELARSWDRAELADGTGYEVTADLRAAIEAILSR